MPSPGHRARQGYQDGETATGSADRACVRRGAGESLGECVGKLCAPWRSLRGWGGRAPQILGRRTLEEVDAAKRLTARKRWRRSERPARAQRPRALRYCLESRPPGSSSERPGRRHLKRARTRAYQIARSLSAGLTGRGEGGREQAGQGERARCARARSGNAGGSGASVVRTTRLPGGKLARAGGRAHQQYEIVAQCRTLEEVDA